MSAPGPYAIVVRLSKGNFEPNWHYYLKDAIHLFPSDTLGTGAKRADRNLLIRYSTGDSVETDIDASPSHRFFRDRSTVRKFFETSGLKPGDSIVVELVGKYEVEVRPL